MPALFHDNRDLSSLFFSIFLFFFPPSFVRSFIQNRTVFRKLNSLRELVSRVSTLVGYVGSCKKRRRSNDVLRRPQVHRSNGEDWGGRKSIMQYLTWRDRGYSLLNMIAWLPPFDPSCSQSIELLISLLFIMAKIYRNSSTRVPPRTCCVVSSLSIDRGIKVVGNEEEEKFSLFSSQIAVVAAASAAETRQM